MRLAPGAQVVEHADINYHWHYRVRIHIPVITRPEVIFHCGGDQVHMPAGEAWLFDSWRLHRVENPTDQERIHLVADTTGTAAFWRFAGLSVQPGRAVQRHRYDPNRNVPLLLERATLAPVMAPAEVELFVETVRVIVPNPPGSKWMLLELKANAIEGDERVADKFTVPFNPALERVSVEVPELPATKLVGTIAPAEIVNSALTVTDN